MPPVEVAFACVREDRSEWLDRLWNVVFSVRSFGGALAGAPFHVFVADSASDRLRDLLVPLGATVSVVAPWRADYRLANKLRMFEAASSLDADVVIALDCDTVVLGDVTPLLDAAAVRALPAEHDRLEPHQWASLYAHLGLTPPTERVVMTKTGATTSRTTTRAW